MRTRWLDRRIAAPGPYLALCLTEAEYEAAFRKLKVHPGRWISAGAHATTHVVAGPRGVCCVVCMDTWLGRDPIEVAGLLVHEAVHVWQHYCDHIGEHRPGAEQEAYGIQALVQELLAEFARRMP